MILNQSLIKKRSQTKQWVTRNPEKVKQYYQDRKEYFIDKVKYTRSQNLEKGLINGLKARFIDEYQVFNQNDRNYILTMNLKYNKKYNDYKKNI